MKFKMRNWCILIFLISLTRGEDGSLQTALNAISRRQRDLPDYAELRPEDDLSHYGYLQDNGDELAFLSPTEQNNQYPKMKNVDHLWLDYLEGGNVFDNNDIDRHISSSFRERLDENKAHSREKEFLNKLQQNADNEESIELLQELWGNYKKAYPELYEYNRIYSPNDIRKRGYIRELYPNLGFDSVGMKKRRYYEQDPNRAFYLMNYSPRDEVFTQLQDELVNNKQRYQSKRFPVTKRSSNYYPIPYTDQFTRQYKRSPKKESIKTDPKVAEDLSNIFAPKSKKFEDKPKRNDKPSTKPNKTEHVIEPENQKNQSANTKEVAPTVHKEIPLQIKKKSINWSDYFGLDRRKKSEDLDNEWLMERYHKAVAMATKRTSENDHQEKLNKKNEKPIDESKINEMDTKLKNIEYSIVDDALKYTGAHEGATDSEEIQEVKDRVISQLAAAYSLEKMRRALGEYKQSIERERNRLKAANKENSETFLEEKRYSVPRKSAIDVDRQKAVEDNNIKCTQNDENCIQQNYKVPSDIMEQINWDTDCPRVQRACNDIGTALGHYGNLLENACVVHQMCLICGDNTWFAPTRQCNVLFLTKADQICNDDKECQAVAKQSIRYLLEINRSLRAESLETCDLACPDKR